MKVGCDDGRISKKVKTTVHKRPLASCRECSFVNSRQGKPSDTDDVLAR
jgi:hypothetical protein